MLTRHAAPLLSIACMLGAASIVSAQGQTDEVLPQQERQVQQVQIAIFSNRPAQRQAQVFEAPVFPLSSTATLQLNLNSQPLDTRQEEEVRDALARFHRALDPSSGDNLLAEVWNVDEGRVRFNATSNRELIEDYDAAEHGHVKKWLQTLVPQSLVEGWLQQDFQSTYADDEYVMITMHGVGLSGVSVSMQRQGDGYQIIEVAFWSYGC